MRQRRLRRCSLMAANASLCTMTSYSLAGFIGTVVSVLVGLDSVIHSILKRIEKAGRWHR